MCDGPSQPRYKELRAIVTPGAKSLSNGVASSCDGLRLFVSDFDGGSHSVSVFSVVEGSRLGVVGGPGAGPLQFKGPRQVCVAADGHVFVADHNNHRVQVLTPELAFHSFLGVEHVRYPTGVCANADVVVVTEAKASRVTVFSRLDGSVVRRFGSNGNGDGQLNCPLGLCFMASDRYVAVAEHVNHRVSVFSVDGDFVRHVGVGVLRQPQGVAALAGDRIVVADGGHRCVRVFGAAGELLSTFGRGNFSGVTTVADAVVAQDSASAKCMFFACCA
jgi:DNA-binding beta-propeller fold protein YncE